MSAPQRTQSELELRIASPAMAQRRTPLRPRASMLSALTLLARGRTIRARIVRGARIHLSGPVRAKNALLTHDRTANALTLPTTNAASAQPHPPLRATPLMKNLIARGGTTRAR